MEYEPQADAPELVPHYFALPARAGRLVCESIRHRHATFTFCSHAHPHPVA